MPRLQCSKINMTVKVIREICAMHVALPVFMVTEIYGAKPYCSQLINIRKKNMINHCTYVPVHEGN